MYSRRGRVRGEVDSLDSQDVALRVGAVLQRVVAGDGELGVESDLGAAEQRARGGGGQEGRGDSEELHLAVRT